MSSCAADEPQTSRRRTADEPIGTFDEETCTARIPAERMGARRSHPRRYGRAVGAAARDAKAERRGGGGEGGCVQRAAEGAGEVFRAAWLE